MSELSVVRIYATTQDPDYDNPWQASTPSNGTGSGVIIGDGKILTGAHVVANSTFLQVQKVSETDKMIARVEDICHDCDLALLAIDNPKFMEGIQPAELGALPNLRDRVSVVGYPVGGEEISITEGVVSRIEVQRYSHSQRHLLAVTVDAAINSGNSGGPVFHNGKVSGIAFQKINNADNIGEMVPVPLIRRFLEGVKRKTPNKVPGLGFSTQRLENAVLREKVGLKESESGILIASVAYGNPSWNVLKTGDVLLKINGLQIANNGTVQYSGKFRTRFDVILGEHHFGDKIPMSILRDGQRMELELELGELRYLVPRSEYDKPATYFIYAGLVFQPLSRNFLATWKNWWDEGPKEFLYNYYSGIPTEKRQEIVVLSQVLADEVNVGYESFYNESVVSINGEEPRNIIDFAKKIEQSGDILEIKTSGHGMIVLDKRLVAEAQERILSRYHIHKDHSLIPST